MSRAYRIKVRESLSRILRAQDRVSTQLELLEILPAEQMAALLADELARRGFGAQENERVRTRDGVTVRVDPRSGTVTVETEASEAVDLQGEREGSAYDDVGPGAHQVRKNLRAEVRDDLERQASEKTATLQVEVTARLEKHLLDLRQELNAVVNQATAEALKRKAAQMGQIKEITEDTATGSLTIVVEV